MFLTNQTFRDSYYSKSRLTHVSNFLDNFHFVFLNPQNLPQESKPGEKAGSDIKLGSYRWEKRLNMRREGAFHVGTLRKDPRKKLIMIATHLVTLNTQIPEQGTTDRLNYQITRIRNSSSQNSPKSLLQSISTHHNRCS